MDKFVELLGTQITQLEHLISQKAPEVWAIYLKQQIINGWLAFLIPLSFVILFFTISYCTRNIIDKECHEPIYKWIFLILGCITTVVFICLGCSSGLPHLLNPEYYAIRELVGSIK